VLKTLLLLLFFIVFVATGWSQDPENKPKQELDSLKLDLKEQGILVDDALLNKYKRIDPLAPSKAAFYSAVFPGLGQIYNKRYWKLPLVYGAIGTGIYAYTFNNNQYNRARAAFKRRKAGFMDDEFYALNGQEIDPGNPRLGDDDLQRAQERFQEDRDLSLLITIGLYVLNIVDANVDAHLKQFNIDDDLSFKLKPYLEYNTITANPNYGLALQLKF
tara:strand:- start:2080 stop:2730 length:651 start_codon:yes stop_codon:yes gene_type:complete